MVYCSFGYLLPYFTLNSHLDAMLYGSFWATIYCLIAHSIVCNILWHFLNLSLTCYYFKLKSSFVNRRVNQCKKSTRNAFKLMEQLDSLHLEIHQCNSQFWSLYLARILCELIFAINFLTYCCLFIISINLIIQILLCIFVCWIFILLSVFLIGPSIVAYETNVTYKLFYKLYIRMIKEKRLTKLQKIKVRIEV